MRRERTSSLAAMLVIMVAVLVAAARGGTTPSQCTLEKDELVKACRSVIFGRNPSAYCCQRVRVTHVECICPYVTPKVANLVNVERTIKQIQACGRTVPHNFKCGSITTP